jgi:penicillin-binding protein 1A
MVILDKIRAAISKGLTTINLWGGGQEVTQDFRQKARKMWKYFIFFLVGIAGLFIFLSLTKMPSLEELENPINDFATEVYSPNGEVLGRYYIENRVALHYKDLNPNLVKALIATEDQRFYQHAGIDFEAVARVATKTIFMMDRSAGGGSTITQQLAKLLFSNRDFSDMGFIRKAFSLVFIKLKEWILAVKLERRYTKEEIIAMYLNQFNFINGAYGIEAASETYFGKNQKDLELHEAATLIGMLNNPALFNPKRRPLKVIGRRNTVLQKMVENGVLDEKTYLKYAKMPLDMTKFKVESHSDGIARYFLMEQRKDIEKILALPECKKPDGTKYNIYRDGLKVYSTIDPVIQKKTEEAVNEHMAEVQKRFWAEWRGLDPWKADPDKIPLEIRQDGLRDAIRQSDRYYAIREVYFDDAFQKLKEKSKIQGLQDKDLEMLFKDINTKKYFKEKLAKREISEDKVQKLKQLQDLDEWPSFKEAWLNFQWAVKKSFDTPVRMKVFAYGAANQERDTTMTPLDSIRYHHMILQCGVIAIEPNTGYIKAWVGGVNYKRFQYDHVRTNRQVGSTFKPFIYATAIEQRGFSPCFPVADIQYTIKPGEANFEIEEPWIPKNSEGRFSGRSMNLYEGLQKSVNSISVYLIKQIGDTYPIRGMLHSMGIDSNARRYDGEYRIPKQPSIALGSADLTAYEMTAAYATFANHGIFVKPTSILEIRDKNNKLIYRSIPEEQVAISKPANNAMVELLKYALKEAAGFAGTTSEVGGKTGTTNDHVDGWFMGITPQLAVGTWVGGDSRWIRFRTFANGQGSKMARPIFSKLIGKLEKLPDVYDAHAKFVRLPPPLAIETNCARYSNPNSAVIQQGSKDEEMDKEFEQEHL